ncbi:MAG TPA: DNA repair protein RecO [Candidatus Polarisedimenticolia bacterium]|nr:DNA repair protein RecO [Candidatus Polarisedimenticolia bacterium]
MPLKRSEAFVIDVLKMQEADRLVVLFTEDEGKVRGVAASAARSHRRFGGKLERLSRVRATWFEKEGRDLARIDACDLVEESFTLYGDLRTAALLAYVAEIVDTFAHEREADPRYFRLLRSLIEAARAGVDPLLLARYFEVWTLRLHGLMPSLDACGECGSPLAAPGAVLGGADAPEAFCPSCRRRGGLRLSPQAIAALDLFRRSAPAALGKAAASAAALGEVEAAAVAVLTSFVGRPFRSYRFLREMALESDVA